MPVQPDFEIEAAIPDGDDRSVPAWSDLTLIIERDGPPAYSQRLDLTRAAGEAIVEALHGALHPWAGMSIIDHIWAALDDEIDTLKSSKTAGEWNKGRALGLAQALALMYNPIEPNVDAVRETAMERWEDRQ
jgi:hypothetical protein